MNKLGKTFNRFADKIVDATLVTRTGTHEIKIPMLGGEKSGTLSQWFEARKIGKDEYKIFMVQQKSYDSYDGFERLPANEAQYTNPTSATKFGGTEFFTLAQAREFLTVLESGMMRNKALQVGRKPSSVGVFTRYYK